MHSDHSFELIEARIPKRTISDGVIALRFRRHIPGWQAIENVPSLLFDILEEKTGRRIGEIDLRLGYCDGLALYSGHLGYHIFARYRRRGYATAATLLLAEVAREHNMRYLWITCNPENIASQKTIEAVGASFVNRVAIPEKHVLWKRGDREKLRYLWHL